MEELEQRVVILESRARACGCASANFFGERIENKLIYNGAYNRTESSAQHLSATRDVAAVLLVCCSAALAM